MISLNGLKTTGRIRISGVVTANPPVIEPAPTAFGDAFGGGFYAGMIWNQLVQSSTSTAIGTGTKAFTVSDQAAIASAYTGQLLEIRSRANPYNKMVGVVTGAAGTTLTMDITSIGGSGTFTDWSIMARYRIIVAPKATGETTGIAIKSTASALPNMSQTIAEGWASTNAMRDADTSAVYPAAHWARGLNIGGFTDWYIPARDELELCWRNLKPSTYNNYVASQTRYSFNVHIMGAYADSYPGTSDQGINLNSYPASDRYTSLTPAQAESTLFQMGGQQSLSSNTYSSSSYHTGHGVYTQRFDNAYPGYQGFEGTNMLRAVRRVIV